MATVTDGTIIEFPIVHKTSEVICVHCRKRWIFVRPVGTLLKDLECPECTNQGYVVETGEIIIND